MTDVAEKGNGSGPLLRLDAFVASHRPEGVAAEGVRPVSLELWAGRVTATIGPNGCGKTSTLHGLLGLAPTRAGQAYVPRLGRALRGGTRRRVIDGRLSPALQRLRIFPSLTPGENLAYAARSQRRDGRAPLGALAHRPAVFGLVDRILRSNRSASTLSFGEQQLLNLLCAVAALATQGVLCLDEPLSNLAPDVAMAFARMLTVEARDRNAALWVLDVEDGSSLTPFREAADVTVTTPWM